MNLMLGFGSVLFNLFPVSLVLDLIGCKLVDPTPRHPHIQTVRRRGWKELVETSGRLVRFFGLTKVELVELLLNFTERLLSLENTPEHNTKYIKYPCDM